LLGLLVSANKILNIVGKRFYKHPKEFFVSVGEEVSNEVIFPIAFTKEENRQSQLIWRQIMRKIPNGEVSSYFADPMSNVLDKQKITDAIQEAIVEMPSHERDMISVVVDSGSLVNQIIINRFVTLQLNSKRESQTKLLFDDLKADCLEVVERESSPSGEFTINPNKLNNLMKRFAGGYKVDGALNESLIIDREGVNMGLLKDAILAHAFETHSIDISPVDVDISVKQVVKSGSFFKFLKLDLRDIFLNEKNKIDYGINYKIFDDKLCFYGVVQRHFRDRKLAVQIMSLRHRILKEIWIHGVSSEFQKDEAYLMKDESEARGRGYERL